MKIADVIPILERELGPQGLRLAEVLCKELSGETLYFPKRPEKPRVSPADTPKTLQSKYGISRGCSYQWLAKYRAR